mmetsp:Transcript_15927/g.25985  ORF Transcript_15927/g.25985 Transcript_15927/m.25985 type:complete len:388 (+) Transcript_15927:40-1203(+)
MQRAEVTMGTVERPQKPAGFMFKKAPKLFMCISRDKGHELVELTREEILAIARNAIPPLGEDIQLTETIHNEHAFYHDVGKGRLHMLRFRGTLQPRDLRMFDPSFSNSHDPEVLVRRHAVLLNLDPIKALFLHDRFLVFVADGFDSVLSPVLMHVHKFAHQVSKGVPFEVIAYESVLVSVCGILQAELDQLQPLVLSTIAEVLHTTGGVVLEKLRRVNTEVDQFENKASAIHKALYDLLQSDHDMALMSLSRIHARPEDYLAEFEDRWSYKHEEVELLIENYLQIVDGCLAKIKRLNEELEDARSTTSLRLSTAQNKLLSVELLVSSVMAVGTFGALVAAMFGMNLTSGIEDFNHCFWTVFIIVIGGGPVIIFLLFRAIKRKGLLIT